MLGLSSVPQTLVSWLLHKVAGKYIEDIDSRIKDVSFGPFGGKHICERLHSVQIMTLHYSLVKLIVLYCSYKKLKRLSYQIRGFSEYVFIQDPMNRELRIYKVFMSYVYVFMFYRQCCQTTESELKTRSSRRIRFTHRS